MDKLNQTEQQLMKDYVERIAKALEELNRKFDALLESMNPD